MLAVDPILTEAIAGSFRPFVRVDSWYNGNLLFSDLPVESGSVTVDSTSLIQRTLSVTVVGDDPRLDPDFVGADGTVSAVGCDGQELVVHAGVLLPDGRPVTCQVGVFVISEVDPKDTWLSKGDKGVLLGTRVVIKASDRALKVSEDRFYTAAASQRATMYGEISLLLWPLSYTGKHQVADRSIGSIVYESDDRLAACDAVAKAGDARLAWDVMGAAVLLPRSWSSGEWVLPERDVVVDVTRKRSRSDIYNVVVSEGGDSVQAPLYGVESEALGPYRALGPFGRRPYKRRAPFATTQSAIDNDARSTLSNITLRRQQTATIESPWNPALEALDLVTWRHPSGVWKSGQVESFTLRFDGTQTSTVLLPHPIAEASR